MGNFFHGWRRNAGVAALLMASAECFVVARGQAINNGVPEFPATIMTLLAIYLILWKPRKRKSSEQPAI